MAGRPTYGKLLPWIKANVSHEGDACLIWPFYFSERQRPKVRIDGEIKSAANVLCELAHGPAPSFLHQAAHSCGNGDKGCMNQKHIRWATPQENSDDRILHGRSCRGEKSPAAKLSKSDVKKIIRRLDKGQTLQDIADDFGVTFANISCIKLGKSWGWLTGKGAQNGA